MWGRRCYALLDRLHVVTRYAGHLPTTPSNPAESQFCDSHAPFQESQRLRYLALLLPRFIEQIKVERFAGLDL